MSGLGLEWNWSPPDFCRDGRIAVILTARARRAETQSAQIDCIEILGDGRDGQDGELSELGIYRDGRIVRMAICLNSEFTGWKD